MGSYSGKYLSMGLLLYVLLVPHTRGDLNSRYIGVFGLSEAETPLLKRNAASQRMKANALARLAIGVSSWLGWSGADVSSTSRFRSLYKLGASEVKPLSIARAPDATITRNLHVMRRAHQI